MGNVWNILFSAVLAGIFSVDRSAFGQFQISRPLVAAPVLGIVLGSPVEGAIIGLAYELLFLRSLPVGSFIPNHPLFPSLVTVMLVGTYAGPQTGAVVIGAAIFFSLPTFVLDQVVNVLWRRSNAETYYRAEAYIRLGRNNQAQLLHLLALTRAALFHGGAFLLSGAILVPLFGAVLKQYPGLTGLLSMVAVIPFFTGLAGIAADRTGKRGWLGFASGLSAGVCAGLWWTSL